MFMKKLLCTTVAVFFLFVLSCKAGIKSEDMISISVEVGKNNDYTGNAAAIEKKKQQMLAVADRTGRFIFSDDTKLQAQDPHAYWLMNAMMQMNQLVETADDAWAWMLAMNENVEEYNKRLGRKIGSVKAATIAIDELIRIYCIGSQPEMNTATYVDATLVHYRTIYEYYSIINLLDNGELKNLYYKEYKEWYAINDAMDDIMILHTFSEASYTSLAMDLNGLFESWSKKRLDELEIEKDIVCFERHWKPFVSDAKTVSSDMFDTLCYTIGGYMTPVGMTQSSCEKYDGTESHILEFCKLVRVVNNYKKALNNWLEVREQIKSLLDEEKQESYREITKQVYTRLYNELLKLRRTD